MTEINCILMVLAGPLENPYLAALRAPVRSSWSLASYIMVHIHSKCIYIYTQNIHECIPYTYIHIYIHIQ